MTVVKADGYGHGMVPGRPGRPRGRGRVARRRHDRRGARAARRRRHRPGAVLARRPRRGLRRRVAADVDVTAYSVAELDEIAAAAAPPAARPALQLKVDTGLSRGGAPLADLAGRRRRGPRRRGARRLDRSPASGRTSPAATSPTTPPTTRRRPPSGEALDVADAAGLRPEVRHLANSAAAILRPSSRFDLVRCGIASYGLDPAPGAHPRPRAGARDDRARHARRWSSGSPPAPGVSYGHTWHRRPRPTTVGLVPVGYGDGVPRHAGNRAEVLVGGRAAADPRAGSAWTSSSSTSTATLPAAGDRRRALRRRPAAASRPRRTGPRPAAPSATRSSPGSAAGFERRYVDEGTSR